MNYKLICKQCDTPVSIKKSKIYMKCMCDEDIRVINYNPSINLKLDFVPDNLYLLKTEGISLCHDGNLQKHAMNLSL